MRAARHVRAAKSRDPALPRAGCQPALGHEHARGIEMNEPFFGRIDLAALNKKGRSRGTGL
ncbi:MAG TPA: hypothetical protein VHN79_06605, partial [Lacunisphaera sp.]|nr:hypothetical protein [Lacunisphaera sp.]